MKLMRIHILKHLCALLLLCCAPSAMAQLSVDAPAGLTQRKTSGGAAKADSNGNAATPAKAKEQVHTQTHTQSSQSQQHRGGTNSSVAVQKEGNKVRVQSQTVQRNITGYRVQVYFSSAKNGKSVARDRAKQVAMRYPQYRTYISYVAPQWRLRIGDFKDRQSAHKFASRLKASFSGFRREVVVVTDKINVWGN